MTEYKYYLTRRRNPLRPLEPGKFYAALIQNQRITSRDVAKQLVKMTGMSMLDAQNATNAVAYILSENLALGNQVDFGGLGRFSLSITSDGSEDIENFNPRSIKIKKVNFKPGEDVKDALKQPTFRYVKAHKPGEFGVGFEGVVVRDDEMADEFVLSNDEEMILEAGME